MCDPAQTMRAGPLLGVGWGAGAVVFEPRQPWRGRQPSRHLSLRPCDFVGDSDARGTPAPAPTPSLGRSEHLDRPLAAQAPSASLLRRRGGWALRRVARPVAPVPGRAGFPWPSSPSVAPGLPCAPGHQRLPGRGLQRCGPGLPLPSTRASPSDVPSRCLARATAHSGQRSVSPVLGEWPPTPAGPTTSWSPWSPRGRGAAGFPLAPQVCRPVATGP